MGTRCLTVFVDLRKDEKGKEIAVLYRQMDGYPDGHGAELQQFLAKRPIVNGYNSTDEQNKAFNGMGCLAASVVAHFKQAIGEFYLHPPGTRDIGEEYIYTVTGKPGDVEATIQTKEA